MIALDRWPPTPEQEADLVRRPHVGGQRMLDDAAPEEARDVRRCGVCRVDCAGWTNAWLLIDGKPAEVCSGCADLLRAAHRGRERRTVDACWAVARRG